MGHLCQCIYDDTADVLLESLPVHDGGREKHQYTKNPEKH